MVTTRMTQRSLRLLLTGLCACVLASCQSTPGPTGAGAGKGSVYGDKPGPKGFSTVVLDAGHGGKDSGARARGLTEKTLALDIAKRVRSELRGYRVVMVRESDHFEELDSRVHIANRHPNGVLLSIHLNYGARSRSGPETYYWRSDSYALARRIQNGLSAAAPYERGNAGLVRRRLRLTRNPTIPCVLVECGYLTNASEAGLLTSASYRQKLAAAIARAVKDQSANGDSGMGPIPRPIYAPPSRAGDARG